MDRLEAHKLLAAESPAWAITEGGLEGVITALTVGAALPARSRQQQPPPRRVGIIPIVGVLTRRPSMFAALLGLGDLNSYQGIARRLANLLADKHVDRIALMVDSPGGVAAGVEELAHQIHESSKVKPIITIVDGLMASAAFWLGAAAGRVVASPSSEVGSVGVVAIHMDASQALAKAGLKPTVLVSDVSPFKAEGNPMEPLTKEARSHFQGQLDAIGATFIRDLARFRGTTVTQIKARFGKGRTLMADEALKVGMIDSVVIGTAAGALPDISATARRPAGALPTGSRTQPGGSSHEDRKRRLEMLR